MFGSWATPSSAALPPDVILEVGPQPCSSRYAAHASLLAVHSGYFRAALRTVDQNHATSGPSRRVAALPHPSQLLTSVTVSSSTSGAPGSAATALLYLPNVTAEQFTPLLTYMYTGYLELTVDNIFGVLLATHLLHMPRALELCRTFLSSSSSTLYMVSAGAAGLVPPPGGGGGGGGPLMERGYYGSKTTTPVAPSEFPPRLVRPIASKASATVGLNFICPPTASQISLQPSAPFRSLGGPSLVSPLVNHVVEEPPDVMVSGHGDEYRDSPSQSPISVTQYDDDDDDSAPLPTALPYAVSNDDNSRGSITVDVKCDEHETANENEPNPKSVRDEPRAGGTGEMSTKGQTSANRVRKHSSTPSQPASVKKHKPNEVAADDGGGGNGVIVDIASCDGPVRFRRVLNVMYGCNKNDRSPNNASTQLLDEAGLSDGGGGNKKLASHHRSTRYAAASFHQQMARNISDTGKLTEESSSSSSYDSLHSQPKHPYKLHGKLAAQPPDPPPRQHDQQTDENSQEDNKPYEHEANGAGGGGSSCYTCVYCNHSFKSHYCYQKHAKRHLIPLRVDHGSNGALTVSATCKYAKIDGGGSNAAPFSDGRRRSQASSNIIPINSSGGSGGGGGGAIKREVKPLDMNVQYYPCKTCGSKFPSYYFVHKHRKLCHAEEEDDAAGHGSSTTATPSRTPTQAEVTDRKEETTKERDQKSNQIAQQG